MDRLVSAYRNKLECRAGKEYYYQVIITIITTQGNYNSSQKVTTLLLPVQFTFEECFLQEHGKKAVQSYRRAGKLNFGEKRWKKKHAHKLGDAIAISKICH